MHQISLGILNKRDCPWFHVSSAALVGLLGSLLRWWVQRFMVTIGVTDNLQLELWGVWEGLQLVKSLGITRLIVKQDVVWVVNMLSRPFEAGHPLGTLIDDSLVLIQEGRVLNVHHILREKNRCAHHLANLAQTEAIAGASVYLSNPPLSLLSLLHEDSKRAW
ncbi:hypothetical protein Gotur_033666 [Gossypium turneri]